MAKAGRPKGRPRKLDIPIGQTTTGEGAESSKAAESRDLECEESYGTAESGFAPTELEIGGKKITELESEEEKERTAAKVEEGEVPPLKKRGMPLGYVAPILVKGIPTAKLCKLEVEKESMKWKKAVIMYVIGDAPTISSLRMFLQKQCEITGKLDIYYHNEGYFVVRFETVADKEGILGNGPLMLGSRPIIVKDWVPNFCFEDEVLKEVPLWIRLPKLPLDCWSRDSLSRIGSVIGRPLCADECTTEQRRISYARMLVEVDITKPLVYKVQVEGGAGMIEQQVYYEWAPLYCQKCHQVGHICKEKKPEHKKQWQPKETEKKEEVSSGKEQEEWTKPKQAASASFQVGHIHVLTGNSFEELGIIAHTEGGDLIPKGGT